MWLHRGARVAEPKAGVISAAVGCPRNRRTVQQAVCITISWRGRGLATEDIVCHSHPGLARTLPLTCSGDAPTSIITTAGTDFSLLQRQI